MLPQSALHGKVLPYDTDKGKKASNILSSDKTSTCYALGDRDILGSNVIIS